MEVGKALAVALAFGVAAASASAGGAARPALLGAQPCAEAAGFTCSTLTLLDTRYCDAGSGWACNEMGIFFSNSRNVASAREMFIRGCTGGFQGACDNGRLLDRGSGPLRSADPQMPDYEILLREGKGPLPPLSPHDIYARACTQGWSAACATESAEPRR